MKFKGLVSSLSLLFLLGSGLLTFFVILSGSKTTGVMRHFYWFEADTRGFSGAPSTTRWYNYKWCAYENDKVGSCSGKKADMPFSPKDNFGNSPNLPKQFRKNRDGIITNGVLTKMIKLVLVREKRQICPFRLKTTLGIVQTFLNSSGNIGIRTII